MLFDIIKNALIYTVYTPYFMTKSTYNAYLNQEHLLTQYDEKPYEYILAMKEQYIQAITFLREKHLELTEKPIALLTSDRENLLHKYIEKINALSEKKVNLEQVLMLSQRNQDDNIYSAQQQLQQMSEHIHEQKEILLQELKLEKQKNDMSGEQINTLLGENAELTALVITKQANIVSLNDRILLLQGDSTKIKTLNLALQEKTEIILNLEKELFMSNTNLINTQIQARQEKINKENLEKDRKIIDAEILEKKEANRIAVQKLNDEILSYQKQITNYKEISQHLHTNFNKTTQEMESLRQQHDTYRSLMSNIISPSRAENLIKYANHMNDTITYLEKYSNTYVKKVSIIQDHYVKLVDAHDRNSILTTKHSSLLVRYADDAAKKVRLERVMSIKTEMNNNLDDDAELREMNAIESSLNAIKAEIEEVVITQAQYRKTISDLGNNIESTQEELFHNREQFLQQLENTRKAFQQFKPALSDSSNIESEPVIQKKKEITPGILNALTGKNAAQIRKQINTANNDNNTFLPQDTPRIQTTTVPASRIHQLLVAKELTHSNDSPSSSIQDHSSNNVVD